MKKILPSLILALAIVLAIVGYIYYPVPIFQDDHRSDESSKYRAEQLNTQTSTNTEALVYEQVAEAASQLLPQQKEASERLLALFTKPRYSSRKQKIQALEYFKNSGLEEEFRIDRAKDPKSWSVQRSRELIKESQGLVKDIQSYLDGSSRWFPVADIELAKVLKQMERHQYFLALLYDQTRS